MMNGKACLCVLAAMLPLAKSLPTLPGDEPAVAQIRMEETSVTSSNVGMPAAIRQIVLPGSELTIRRADSRDAPVVMRIDAIYPHGDGFRYDLTWTALEPGTHNLAHYLERKDGSTTDDLPSIPVQAASVLAPEQMLPNAPRHSPTGSAGGYRTLLIIGGILWCVGLVLILVSGRNVIRVSDEADTATPRTRLDQIRGLLCRALEDQEFTVAEKARLEGLIVGFWRDDKQIGDLAPQEAFAVLQNDQDAGPLLRQLERWLYDRPQSGNIDLNSLLAPFQNMADRATKAAAGVGAVQTDSQLVKDDSGQKGHGP